ncbi:hypothetical protein [Flaviflexus huanghaiensis]|uniref:hypothetical protein n=1 Tax=Flaviflexus huanghaiensis TaxID=1111473 RepID=UPI0015FA5707|nr:hypothetical protein [Flaviflexus huanghaiensis]
MSNSFNGTSIYAAIPERGQQGVPLAAGDLVDVRVLARERFALFAERPGGRIIHANLPDARDFPEWPSLMFRCLIVGETVVRVVEELPDWLLFGPRGKAIEDLIDQYLFLDDQGKESYHRVERLGRAALREYAKEENTGDAFIESIFDGTVFGGEYGMACRALYYLANSQSAQGPLALAIAIVLRDGLGESAYERIVEPYREADIPFMERVDEA